MVTYGRTGSTLLQGLLNTCPRTLIFGENWAFFYHLFKLREAVRTWRAHTPDPSADGPTLAFYGATRFDFAGIDHRVRDIESSFFANYGLDYNDYDVIGFKDTQYALSDIDAYLDYLAKTFANPFFLFLRRDIEDVARSGFFKSMPTQDAIAALSVVDAEHRRVAETLGEDRAYALDYQDVVTLSPRFFDLLGRLGLQADRKRLNETLLTKHSYDQRSFVAITPGVSLLPNLRLLDENFLHHRLEHWSGGAGQPAQSIFTLSGVLLPRSSDERLERLYWRSSTGEKLQAAIGRPSPGVAKTHPEFVQAANARFRFSEAASPRLDHSMIYELVAELRRSGTFILARLTVLTSSAG